MAQLFNFIVFPGFLFTITISYSLNWIDNKLTARLHHKKGPSFRQTFYNLIKLFNKDIILNTNRLFTLFISLPFLSIISITIASTTIWQALLNKSTSLSGDIILILYLLLIPKILIIIGSAASANPLVSQRVGQETKLLLGYKIPFILAAFVPVIKANNTLKITQIIAWQTSNQKLFFSFSGFLAFLVICICTLAILNMPPFDTKNQAKLNLIDYSGPPLALYIISKLMLSFTIFSLIISLFFGGIIFQGWNIISSILAFILIFLFFIFIKNSIPKININHSLKFFLLLLNSFAIIAIILANLGY
jgi:NADH-quinone oxidoreductase subunit H